MSEFIQVEMVKEPHTSDDGVDWESLGVDKKQNFDPTNIEFTKIDLNISNIEWMEAEFAIKNGEWRPSDTEDVDYTLRNFRLSSGRMITVKSNYKTIVKIGGHP